MAMANGLLLCDVIDVLAKDIKPQKNEALNLKK